MRDRESGPGGAAGATPPENPFVGDAASAMSAFLVSAIGALEANVATLLAKDPPNPLGDMSRALVNLMTARLRDRLGDAPMPGTPPSKPADPAS